MRQVLDDVNRLANMDPSDMIGAAQNSWQQLEYKFRVDFDITSVDNVVYCGMGGSALAAVLFEAWQKDKLHKPFTYVRDYNIPGWVNEKTLMVVVSFSGNTEETISCFEQGVKAGAQLITVAHGGKLEHLAHENGVPFYKLPDSPQPRMAVFSMLKALCDITDRTGVSYGLREQLELAAIELKESTYGWRRDVETQHNYAKQLAEMAMGKNIEVHGGPLMSAAAYKWKISFNESAKNVAFNATWPEFNHNEFIGWSSHPIEKPYIIYQLRSSFESIRIDQRYDISNRLLSGHMPEPVTVDCYGSTAIEQLLWAVSLGDHVSTYLGILNGQNPAPVDLVEKLKKELEAADSN